MLFCGKGKVKCENSKGLILFMIVFCYGYEKCCKYFIKFGVNFNVCYRINGNISFFFLFEKGYLKVV